jgi:hypothetical protein
MESQKVPQRKVPVFMNTASQPNQENSGFPQNNPQIVKTLHGLYRGMACLSTK